MHYTFYHIDAIWSEYSDFSCAKVLGMYNKHSQQKGGDKKKKELIPGTKIVKVIAGKDNSEEKLRKDLEKIGKIELLGKTIKSMFSI